MNSMTPLSFSIVMPTFKRHHVIDRAVGSVIGQTYQHWQLVVADNNSESERVRDTWNDPRVKVIRCTPRCGVSVARNEGMRQATGDLLAFADDDDRMSEDYMAKVAAAFEANPSLKLVRVGMRFADTGQFHMGYATPECVVRRQYATVPWSGDALPEAHDVKFWRETIAANGFTADDMHDICESLYLVHHDPVGGLRAGWL